MDFSTHHNTSTLLPIHNNSLYNSIFLTNTHNTTTLHNNTALHNTTSFNKTYCSDDLNDLNTVLSILRPSITPIDRYFSLVWFLIGFPGNLFSFFVWVRKQMRPSSGCYLAALALNDFFFLLFFVISELSTAWETFVLNYPVVCELFPVIFYTFQYLSPFLILAFTVERYISICHPYQRDRYCTTKRNLVVIVCLVVYTLLIHSWQVYNWNFDADTAVCNVRESVSPTVREVFTLATEIQAFAIVPLAITLLNVRVIVEIHRINKRANKQQSHSKQSSNHGSSSNSATTATLLLVSFYYIISTLPVTICFVTVPSFHSCLPFSSIATDPQWQYLLNFWNVRVVVQELGASHYACNVIFYLLTGSQFRAESKKMLRKVFNCDNVDGGGCVSCCVCCRDGERGRMDGGIESRKCLKMSTSFSGNDKTKNSKNDYGGKNDQIYIEKRIIRKIDCSENENAKNETKNGKSENGQNSNDNSFPNVPNEMGECDFGEKEESLKEEKSLRLNKEGLSKQQQQQDTDADNDDELKNIEDNVKNPLLNE